MVADISQQSFHIHMSVSNNSRDTSREHFKLILFFLIK